MISTTSEILDIPVIKVSEINSPISVRVSVPRFPQSIAGVIWRYSANERPEGKAGVLTPNIPDVPLGAPSTINNKFFLIEGAVLHHNDNPPTPYQVVVAIIQGGKVIHHEVPSIGGSGQIADKNKPFLYRFKIEEASTV